MSASLHGVEAKLKRANVLIQQLFSDVRAYTNKHPFSLVLRRENQDGQEVIRLVASKNISVGDPDVSLVLLAGEAVYQLRSALDHLVYQLVVLNGNEALIAASRLHQFPIAADDKAFARERARRLTGMAQRDVDVIEEEQPYRRHPGAPKSDHLWLLQHLNNTDKHRLIPVAVTGFNEVALRERDDDLAPLVASIGSPDIVLEDGKVLMTLVDTKGAFPELAGRIHCAVAFEDAMQIGSTTVSIATVLLHMSMRVESVVARFRARF